jgi:hypothetical protein
VIVHFAVIDGAEVRPLCGDWAGSRSWSTLLIAVTCPRCLALLKGEKDPGAAR